MSYVKSLTENQLYNIKLIVSEAISRGITNTYTLAAILAIISKESGFIPKPENLNYTAARLLEVFPSKFKTMQQAIEYAGKPEKIANYVYGGRFGNNTAGDGWRYKGGGHNQLTFRNQYRSTGKAIGVDLENYPEKINEPVTAAKAALSFFIGGAQVVLKKKNLNDYSDLETALKDIYDINAGKRGKHLKDPTGGFKKAKERVFDLFELVKGINPQLNLYANEKSNNETGGGAVLFLLALVVGVASVK